MSTQPKYRVKISDKGTNAKPGYYSQDIAWKACKKEEATKLSHKDARRVAGHMKRLGHYAFVELVVDD